MNKLIALKGVANRGKSQTVKKVYELLLAKRPDAEIAHEHPARVNIKVDFRVVLTIENIKIGIESQGDPSSRLIKESLDLFVKMGCEVIVCATRTWGGTVDAVSALEGYDVVWLDQPVHSELAQQESSNLAMAAKIVDKIENAIGEPPSRARAATH